MSDASNFEEELQWCIQQLKHCLNSAKPGSRKYAEAVRAMKSLSSEKSSLVKKRQTMRMYFGDYRKTMEDEAKKFQKSSKLFVKPVRKIKQPKIAKKCHSKTLDKRINSVIAMEAADQTSTFRFNFSPPDESILVKEAKAQPSSNKIPINYYKMEKPDTSFKFSFSVP